jgi:hypothetical protein
LALNSFFVDARLLTRFTIDRNSLEELIDCALEPRLGFVPSSSRLECAAVHRLDASTARTLLFEGAVPTVACLCAALRENAEMVEVLLEE